MRNQEFDAELSHREKELFEKGEAEKKLAIGEGYSEKGKRK